MSEQQPTRDLLTDEDLDRLGIARDIANHLADLADKHGPLTADQEDRVTVLLRQDPSQHLARGA